MYKNLREVYLPAVDSDRSTVHSFYSFFKDNRDEVLNLAKFTYNGFKVREEKIKQLRG